MHCPPTHESSVVHPSRSHAVPSETGLCTHDPCEHCPVLQGSAGQDIPSATGLVRHVPCTHCPVMHTAVGHAVPSGLRKLWQAASDPVHASYQQAYAPFGGGA